MHYQPLLMRNHLFFLLMICAFCNVCKAQEQPYVYKPFTNDLNEAKKIQGIITERLNGQITAAPATFKKETIDIYKTRHKSIENLATEKYIITEKKAVAYLQQLVNEIVDNNKHLLVTPVTVMFLKDENPNAACYGEGIIFFNLGLFTRLDNESEVAFVISHELAHHYFEHSNKSIARYVNTLYAKETQDRLKQINNKEFGRNADLQKLAQGLSFTHSRHSRDHEKEADSLALVFLKNTKFNTAAAITTLQLLDTIDHETFDAVTFEKQVFNFADAPFKQKWTRKEEGIFGGHAVLTRDSILSDSLKTHPDCQVRIKALQSLVNAGEGKPKSPINLSLFAELKNDFAYELIAHYINEEMYSQSLYHSLALLSKKTNDAYAITATGLAFSNMYAAGKAHRLGAVKEMPSPAQPPLYNLHLQFLENLSLNDIANIGYNFLSQYQNTLSFYGEYNTTLNKCKKNIEN